MATRKGQATLERLESRVDQLPMLPGVVLSVLRLDPKTDTYFDELAALIRSDPSFALRLLRYANSASVAPVQSITTVEHALMLVGYAGAVGLVVGHSAMRVFVPRHDWERDLWRHAIDVACLMQVLASSGAASALDPRDAYLIGLLHDIGRFIMYLEAPDDLRAVDETAWASPQALIEAESAICGFTHAELGYLAIRKWRLSSDLATVIRRHHDNDDETESDAFAPTIQLLQDADWISVTLAVGRDLWCRLPMVDLCTQLARRQVQLKYALAEERFAELVRTALQQSSKMQLALGIEFANRRD